MTASETAEAPIGRASLQGRVIDCDLHPPAPGLDVLLPYLDDSWRHIVAMRSLDKVDFSLTSYPRNAPINCRADWKSDADSTADALDRLRGHILEPFNVRFGVLNCLHGAQVVHSEDMAAAFCRAINTWVAREWLDKEPRLRASIVVPTQNPQLAVAEIERCAQDKRFVQVLMLVMGETTLGRRHNWPIFEAAARLGLPIGIHAGSAYRFAPTAIGWPSFHLEDYVAQSAGFETQLLSLIAEGVFAKYPDLKVVLIESGVTWLRSFIWRADKTWRGVRAEVPWVKQQPSEIIREHVRFTIQPIDAPDEAKELERLADVAGSDELFLFSTDYPHWHFEGNNALPHGLSPALAGKIMSGNALATYSRLEPAHTQEERA